MRISRLKKKTLLVEKMAYPWTKEVFRRLANREGGGRGF